MNVLSAVIKSASIGLLVGCLTSTGPNLGNHVLPLTVLLVFISTILVLFELTNLEPETPVVANAD